MITAVKWMTFDPSTSIFESDPMDNVISPNGNLTATKLIFLGEFTTMLKKISLKMGHPSRGGSASRLPPGLFVSQVLPTSVSSPEPPVPSPVHRSERQRQTQMNARTMQLDYWDLGVREMHGKTQGCFVSQNLFVEVWVLRGFLVGGSQFFGGGCFCWAFMVGHFRWWVRTVRF